LQARSNGGEALRDTAIPSRPVKSAISLDLGNAGTFLMVFNVKGFVSETTTVGYRRRHVPSIRCLHKFEPPTTDGEFDESGALDCVA
jgi:hypothetical protein